MTLVSEQVLAALTGFLTRTATDPAAPHDPGARAAGTHAWDPAVQQPPVDAGPENSTGFIMKIVVIGGTGLIGSKLVTRLRDDGHEPVPASPDSGVDTLTGEGLSEALTGAFVVVDLSNSPSYEDAAVLEFFTTSTRNILAAEAIAGVGHHVALSIVGSDRLPDSGYYRAKVAQEQLIKQSTVPYSIVHATQFFEFAKRIADAATVADTVRLAPVLVQPMAADDVASAIGRIAEGAPVNGTIEVAGPEQFRLDELVRRTLDARHDRREVVTDPHALYFGAELSERTLVPGNDARLGETRFEDWLNQSLPESTYAPEATRNPTITTPSNRRHLTPIDTGHTTIGFVARHAIVTKINTARNRQSMRPEIRLTAETTARSSTGSKPWPWILLNLLVGDTAEWWVAPVINVGWEHCIGCLTRTCDCPSHSSQWFYAGTAEFETPR